MERFPVDNSDSVRKASSKASDLNHELKMLVKTQ